jgi:protein TonB
VSRGVSRAAHVEGTVVIDAIISRAGSIESAHVLSGPPMLQAAALAAVRQARYRPFLLNGQPTEVQTTITINFRMGG